MNSTTLVQYISMVVHNKIVFECIPHFSLAWVLVNSSTNIISITDYIPVFLLYLTMFGVQQGIYFVCHCTKKRYKQLLVSKLFVIKWRINNNIAITAECVYFHEVACQSICITHLNKIHVKLEVITSEKEFSQKSLMFVLRLCVSMG